MLTLEEAIEKFHTELPLEIQGEFGTQNFTSELEAIEQEAGLELSELAINFAVGELTMEMLPGYIQDTFGLDAVKAKSLALELKNRLFDPVTERINFINADPAKTMTLEQEKGVAEKIFHTTLLNELSNPNFLTNAVNMRLFFILARDEAFKKRLEQALYDNDEVVTKNDIVLSGQKVRPTISNWLKDYITQHGSQAHDSVSQSSFLINSENGKSLSQEERDRLANVLKTYINIKFFPDSMPSDDGTGWEIIPGSAVLSEGEDDAEDETAPPAAPAASVPEIMPSSQPIPTEAPATPATQAVKEPSTEVMELKNMLLKYPVGSMERKAIEEELRKVESL